MEEAEGPRYAAIRDAIEARILSGALKPGARLPSEQELVAEYGVSRMTAGRALRELAEAGLVVRRRKAGSFVAAPRAEEALLGISDLRATFGPGHAHAVERREERAATEEDRTRLGALPPRARVLALLVRHRAGERVVALEDRLIHLDAVPEARDESFADCSPGTWLLDHVPWTEAEHRIRAVAAGEEVAALLGIPPGSACLVLERRTWRVDSPVTAVRLTYPGDRHEFSGRSGPSRPR